jgi:hypothetical protein
MLRVSLKQRKKTCDAADLIGAHPPALQLRFFQTLLDLSSGDGTHTYIPIPFDLFDALRNKNKDT